MKDYDKLSKKKENKVPFDKKIVFKMIYVLLVLIILFVLTS